MKKQQIKVKFWIWGPRTVYYNMTCAQQFFQKSLHPTSVQNAIHLATFSPLSLLLQGKKVTFFTQRWVWDKKIVYVLLTIRPLLHWGLWRLGLCCSVLRRIQDFVAQDYDAFEIVSNLVFSRSWLCRWGYVIRIYVVRDNIVL